ncbi:hypothetical protein ACNO8X_27330 [Mycobacterium sp. PDNC021]|uniref:hypothetical protein n=1 Tax=Mycobacterium sp. PDNC021 TaxID=3391399 RepID=UPI003AAD2D60
MTYPPAKRIMVRKFASGVRGNRFARTLPVVVIALLASPMVAAPAHADPVATVKARTQRMSEPNLGSHQDGWYNAGDRVTLMCSQRGQQVKGFFSFNIPGGWDNLWYKTSDGHFVADVDIETGTLNDVTGDCGNGGGPANPPPPAASSNADAALAWANSKIGSDEYDQLCGQFVANAYGQSALGAPTALAFHDRLAGQSKIHMDGAPPAGALVFSRSSMDGNRGHVDLARGDGTFISGGVDPRYKFIAGGYHTVQVLPNWNPSPGATYLGWAYAPW